MLALVSVFVVWACAGWEEADGNMVQVPGGAGHYNQFLRNLIGTAPSPLNDKHPISCVSFYTHLQWQHSQPTFETLLARVWSYMFEAPFSGIASVFSHLSLP